MGLIGVAAASRFATVMMAIFSALAAFASLVIFVIDMVLWNIVRNRVRDAGGSAYLVRLFHLLQVLQVTDGINDQDVGEGVRGDGAPRV